MDSVILTSTQESSLLALTDLIDNSFSLLWRSSRDGNDAETFHRLSDGQGKILTVIRNTNSFIFGGFTSVSWSYEDE